MPPTFIPLASMEVADSKRSQKKMKIPKTCLGKWRITHMENVGPRLRRSRRSWPRHDSEGRSRLISVWSGPRGNGLPSRACRRPNSARLLLGWIRRLRSGLWPGVDPGGPERDDWPHLLPSRRRFWIQSDEMGVTCEQPCALYRCLRGER